MHVVLVNESNFHIQV